MGSIIFSKFTLIICLNCGFECRVEYSSCFDKWRRKVKFCPFCGNDIRKAVSEDKSPIEEDVKGK